MIGTGTALGGGNVVDAFSAATSDMTNTDPLLGGLADNGGLTLTHDLLPGSLAFNAGDPAAVAGVGNTPQFDQRGFDRDP